MKSHFGWKAGITALICASFALPRSAEAAFFSWTWLPGTGGTVNNGAGQLNRIDTSFDTATKRLTWFANFGQVGGGGIQTQGFHLVLSPGPDPKGTQGELAIMYFDASGSGDPNMTCYAYNGLNAASSWYDGSDHSGTQPPDKIKSSLISTNWIYDRVKRVEADGTRTLGFSINAMDINSHIPLYPGPGGVADWTGMEYGSHIGVWFHSYADLHVGYHDGWISSLSFGHEGYLDGSGFRTVPEPAAFAGLAIAGFGLILRRRANKARR